ncbi:MAG: response regulator [Burkholderiales bacterium]
MDDDALLITLVRDLLALAGFDVHCFQSPRAALDALVAAPEQFHAIVTDYNMSSISGIEVVESARKVCPSVPTVVVSGYVDDMLHRRAAQAGVSAIVNKERMTEDLAVTLRRLSDAN